MTPLQQVSSRSEAPKNVKRGDLHSPHTLREEFSNRVVWVPIALKTDTPEWKQLMEVAFHCSAYGNQLLSEQYIQAKGGPKFPTYTDFSDRLSGAVRDAIGREVIGIWRRLGKEILSGRQTLARFRNDRAIVVRDKGITVLEEDKIVIPQGVSVPPGTPGAARYIVQLRLLPTPAPLTRLEVYHAAIGKDDLLNRSLKAMASGECSITKGSLLRKGNRIFALISYRVPVPRVKVKGQTARLVLQDEKSFIRADSGEYLSLEDVIYRLREMKEHFSGVAAQLRHSLSNNSERRRIMRRKLLLNSFENWAGGVLHQTSRRIVAWCESNKVGQIEEERSRMALLPLETLSRGIRYKAEASGVGFFEKKAEKPIKKQDVGKNPL